MVGEIRPPRLIIPLTAKRRADKIKEGKREGKGNLGIFPPLQCRFPLASRPQYISIELMNRRRDRAWRILTNRDRHGGQSDYPRLRDRKRISKLDCPRLIPSCVNILESQTREWWSRFPPSRQVFTFNSGWWKGGATLPQEDEYPFYGRAKIKKLFSSSPNHAHFQRNMSKQYLKRIYLYNYLNA